MEILLIIDDYFQPVTNCDDLMKFVFDLNEVVIRFQDWKVFEKYENELVYYTFLVNQPISKNFHQLEEKAMQYLF